jgi:phage tail sheath gpL-like
MAQCVLLINDGGTGALFPTFANATQNLQGLVSNLTNLFSRASPSGNQLSIAAIAPSVAVQASGTMTGASVVATNAVKVCGVTYTCVNSGAVANQWNKGGTDDLTMIALAAALNADPTINTFISAARTGTAVITLTALQPGTIGNFVPFSQTAGATITCTGSGFLTSGTGNLSAVFHGFGV